MAAFGPPPGYLAAPSKRRPNFVQPLGSTSHLFLVTQVESDRTVNLLQAERGIVRSNRFGSFPVLEFSNHVRQRHTTADEIQAAIPPFNKFSSHRHSTFSVSQRH